MVVKSVRGRRRYISFQVPAGTTRDAISAAVDAADPRPESFKAITCSGGKAVVRCSPSDRDAVVGIVCSLGPEARSLKASGTLRTLRDSDPDLRVPRRKKRRDACAKRLYTALSYPQPLK